MWKRVVKTVLYVGVLSTLLIAFTFAGYLMRSEAFRSVVGGMMGEKPAKVFSENSLNLLVLGCDEERYYGGKQMLNDSARSDMIMLARLDFDKKSISAVSIPRDLRVEFAAVDVWPKGLPRGERSMRINGFHKHGGPAMTQKVVERILDVKVDRTIVLNFQAFQELVDMVGGVDIFVEKRMKYDDVRGGLHIDLQPGKHRLSGYEAMGFVRFRKGEGGANEDDFTRQKRQRELMLALKDRIMANPAKVPMVLDKTVEILDKKLSGRELGSLIWFGQQVEPTSIKMGPVPTAVVSRSPFYLRLQPRRTREMLEEYGFRQDEAASRTSTPRSRA